jgi:hypothetical protein
VNGGNGGRVDTVFLSKKVWRFALRALLRV